MFGVDLSARSRARTLSDRGYNWRCFDFLDSIPARGLRALKVAAVSPSSCAKVAAVCGGHRDRPQTGWAQISRFIYSTQSRKYYPL